MKKGILSLLTVGILVVSVAPIKALADTKQSEVSITFVYPDDPKDIKAIKEQQEEMRKKQVKEVHTVYYDVPEGEYIHKTMVTEEGTTTFITENTIGNN